MATPSGPSNQSRRPPASARPAAMVQEMRARQMAKSEPEPEAKPRRLPARPAKPAPGRPPFVTHSQLFRAGLLVAVGVLSLAPLRHDGARAPAVPAPLAGAAR